MWTRDAVRKARDEVSKEPQLRPLTVRALNLTQHWGSINLHSQCDCVSQFNKVI